MTTILSKMRFSLGKVVITRHALDVLPPDDVWKALSRHSRGDWGDLCNFDWEQNDQALIYEARLLSRYVDRNGVCFWIITEWDRSVTTILLPEDY